MKIRLIESPLALPKYRQVRLPTVAAEFAPYADVEINDENIEPIDVSDVDLVGFTAQAYNAPRAILHTFCNASNQDNPTRTAPGL